MEFVTSCWGASEGLLGRILHCYIWEHVAYVQITAALCILKIPSYLDTDPEFKHQPFHRSFEVGGKGLRSPDTFHLGVGSGNENKDHACRQNQNGAPTFGPIGRPV